MKVAHSVGSIEDLSSGPAYSVTGLAEAQGRLGATAAIFSIGSDPIKRETDFQDYRFENSLEGVPIFNRLKVSKGVNHGISKFDPDIVHTHGLWLAINAYRTSDAKFVISPRGMLSEVALNFSPFRKKISRYLFQAGAFRSAGMFHATAESEYEEIRKFGLSQPVAIIPNGINLPTISTLGPRAASQTAISLGRIHPKKGLANLVKAWSYIERTHPTWRLRIIGPDEVGHLRELREMAFRLGVHSISFESPMFGEEKNRALSDAEFFVLPTRSENFAMTVAESLACGVPVIATEGAPWSGLRKHKCGWWIPQGVEALTLALKTAIEMPVDERRSMGRRGRHWMASDFSWDAIGKMSLEAYEWLLGAGEKPTFVRRD